MWKERQVQEIREKANDRQVLEIKEREKRDNIRNQKKSKGRQVQEVRKLWNVSVTVNQLLLELLEQSGNLWKGSWKSWKSEDESKSSKLQYCWDQSEYWEESWKTKEVCCHSYSTERLSANTS